MNKLKPGYYVDIYDVLIIVYGYTWEFYFNSESKWSGEIAVSKFTNQLYDECKWEFISEL